MKTMAVLIKTCQCEFCDVLGAFEPDDLYYDGVCVFLCDICDKVLCECCMEGPAHEALHEQIAAEDEEEEDEEYNPAFEEEEEEENNEIIEKRV